MIHAGDTVNAAFTGNERLCSFTTVAGGWGGLCEAYEITLPSNGTLTASVHGGANIILFFKTAGGQQIDMACCPTSLPALRVPVDAGTIYRIEVVLLSSTTYPVSYSLDTTLLPTDTQPPSAVRAWIFADSRTQLLATARLEVMDGPKAGALSTFDPSSGIYEIRGLPSGFVTVTASAMGFLALTTRVPVGVSVENEFVLHRQTPLAGANNSLAGTTCAAPVNPGDRPPTCYTGVKVEVLDGPLGGIFTFSDELAMYQMDSLPSGVIRVRGTGPDYVEPQTLEVVVAGRTRLDFLLKRR
jgi:hypothetical protein